MECSLLDYSNRINEIKNNFKNGISFIQTDELFNNIQELSVMQAYLDDVMRSIKLLKQDLHVKYEKMKVIVSETPNTNTYNNTYIATDIFESKQHIIEVESVDDVQSSPIYYIKPLKQYAVSIGGMVLRGNIGNIYNSNMINKIGYANFKDLMYCKHENKCPDILNGKICKYYHDPLQLQELERAGLITTTRLNIMIKTKNHLNTSWIYTDYPEHKNNIHMRHFGSRDTLDQFIQLAKIDKTKRITGYIRNFKDQCIHDILVLFTVYNNGLL